MKNMSTLVFMIIFHLSMAEKMHVCSWNKACKCQEKKEKIFAVCARQNLTVSPTFPSNVFSIDLSYNSLSSVPRRKQLPDKLQYLDISNNMITNFTNYSFVSLFYLKDLNLQKNDFKMDDATFPSYIFRDLKKLTHLNLKGKSSSLRKKDRLPARALSYIYNLESLETDGLKLGSFGESFRKLKKLTRLDLSGRTGYCNIEYITKDNFKNLKHLQHLDISGCKIRLIEKQSFVGLKNLMELDISHNQELTFRVLENLTSDLESTSIEILRLNEIHCTFGRGTELRIKDLKGFQNTSVKEIHVSNNRLELIQSGGLFYLPGTLQKLYASYNRFTFGVYIIESAFLKSIKWFDGSLQHSSHDPTDFVHHFLDPCNDGSYDPHFMLSAQKRSQTELLLKQGKTSNNQSLNHYPTHFNTENETNVITPFWRDKFYQNDTSLNLKLSKGLKKLFFHDNVVNFYRWKDLLSRVLRTTVYGEFPLPPNVETLLLNQSGLRYSINTLNVSKNSIQNLYLQDNALSAWIGPVRGLDHLQFLNMSNNFCSVLSTIFFNFVPNLKTLLINDNLLGYSISQDHKGNLFKNLKMLQYFELKGNKIRSLPENVFRGLSSLRYLDLSENLLEKWNVKLSSNNRVSDIDLSWNQIQDLSSESMDKFDTITRNNKLSLNLLGNPLVCNCKTLHFIEWMYKRQSSGSIKFKHFQHYNCSKWNSSQYISWDFRKLETHLLQLQKECQSYTFMISILAVLISCFLTLLSAAIIYRYRWKLRYFYYMTKSEFHGYQSVRNDNNPDFKFDAFVSYADEDRTFVLRKFITEIERDGNIHLCIHNRDFVPGYDIAENILTGITKSRRTVVILSDDFVKSYWCMYELNMARMESIYNRNGDDVLFLIFYRSISPKDMPLTLMDLIEKKSYIEYPNDEYGDVVFWQKIKDTLNLP